MKALKWTGIALGGRKLGEWMPRQRFQYLTDEEVQALWAHLQTLRGGVARDSTTAEN